MYMGQTWQWRLAVETAPERPPSRSATKPAVAGCGDPSATCPPHVRHMSATCPPRVTALVENSVMARLMSRIVLSRGCTNKNVKAHTQLQVAVASLMAAVAKGRFRLCHAVIGAGHIPYVERSHASEHCYRSSLIVLSVAPAMLDALAIHANNQAMSRDFFQACEIEV